MSGYTGFELLVNTISLFLCLGTELCLIYITTSLLLLSPLHSDARASDQLPTSNQVSDIPNMRTSLFKVRHLCFPILFVRLLAFKK